MIGNPLRWPSGRGCLWATDWHLLSGPLSRIGGSLGWPGRPEPTASFVKWGSEGAHRVLVMGPQVATVASAATRPWRLLKVGDRL